MCHIICKVKAAVIQLLCGLIANVEDLGQRMALRTSLARQGLWDSLNILKNEYTKAMEYCQAETMSVIGMPPTQHSSRQSLGVSLDLGSDSLLGISSSSSSRRPVRKSTLVRKLSLSGHTGFSGTGSGSLQRGVCEFVSNVCSVKKNTVDLLRTSNRRQFLGFAPKHVKRRKGH
jgi:hypothetical protein